MSAVGFAGLPIRRRWLNGRNRRRRRSFPDCWRRRWRNMASAVRCSRSGSAGFPRLVRGLKGNDLLIAIGRAPPAKNEALAIGIAGRGFDGDLTSDSTRTNGYVLSTDIAPTILSRLGIAVPSQMSGQAIRAEGSVDPAAIESLGDADGGDLGAARAGDRDQPARLAGGLRAGRAGQLRSRRPGRDSARRSQHRLPATALAGGRGAQTGSGHRTAPGDVRRSPARRADSLPAWRPAGARGRLGTGRRAPSRST